MNNPRLMLAAVLAMAFSTNAPALTVEERPPYNPPKKAQHSSMPMINNPARHGRPMNRAQRRAKR